MKEQAFYWIYMLRLANGSYYTGYARDLIGRVRAHRSGRGAKITRSFTPVAIAACWKLYSGRGEAMRVEAWIKTLPRAVKQALVNRPDTLKELLVRHGQEAPVEAVSPPPLPSPMPPHAPIDQF